jgi:penicillin-binding protein 1A
MRFLGLLFGTLVIGALVALGAGFWAIDHYGKDLPDYRALANYEPPVTTRFHAGDGSLLAEFARQSRLFVPVSAIPKPLIQAFLSAEDKNFYSHSGIDFAGIARAVLINARNYGSDRRPVGASTITQQVAKNFLVGNERSVARKIREAIIAYRMERTFSKDRILELYLNEIYLGVGSYGVAAAALNYFGKPLDQLTLAECAYLAAIPKGPNNYNPYRAYQAAIERRNWVLDRMAEDGAVPMDEAAAAKLTPLVVRDAAAMSTTRADYFTEEVRRQVVSLFGDQALYEGGLSIRTTLDPKLQAIADRVLRQGLMDYDRRHGWRGPLTRIQPGAEWAKQLAAMPAIPGLVVPGVAPWRAALVLSTDAKSARIGFADGGTGTIPMAELAWARPTLPDQNVGPKPTRPDQVLAVGDVVAVEPVGKSKDTFALRQIPNVGGALVAMDPHTGRVLAMGGGWSFEQSEFNRATQALRQPGSSFKPFVYAVALAAGFSPSSLVLDGPFVADQGPGLPKWKPKNYHDDFLGPTTLRVGLEKSRNLMTVRLAQYLGMDKVADLVRRFGVVDDLPQLLSMALGAGETTLLRMTTGYAEFVNGGKAVQPTLIDRIQDRRGRTVYRHDARPCDGCAGTTWYDQPVPTIPDVRPEVLDAATSYQIVSMLQGVVERGTGSKVREVGKPLAGKTGTSNDSNDVWFVGFSPDLAVGVFVGFDQPRTLGPKETGGSIAAPIFRDFMAAALADQPAVPFRIPPGVRLVRVNAQTGAPAEPGDKVVILDAYKPGTEPFGPRVVLDGTAPASGEPSPSTDAGFAGADAAVPPADGAFGEVATPVAPPPPSAPPPPPMPALDNAPSATGGLY